MSFGANNTSKTAENNLSGTSNLALNNLFPAVTQAGGNLLSQGENTVTPGVNYLQTLLGGNTANTAQALQPNINQIRQGVNQTFQAANSLMPRGGGRSGTLFAQSFAPQSQIQGLFNTARSGAASALPSIGLSETGTGANLYNTGASALGAATGANNTLGQQGFQGQQLSNQMVSGIGSGLFGLLTTPFGGGSAANGLLGKL